ALHGRADAVAARLPEALPASRARRARALRPCDRAQQQPASAPAREAHQGRGLPRVLRRRRGHASHRLRRGGQRRARADVALTRGAPMSGTRETTGDVYREPWTYKPREARVVRGDSIAADRTLRADVCVIGTG